MLTDTSKIIVNSQVAYTAMDDELVMMIPGNSSFFGINAIGSEIWDLLQTGVTAPSTIYEHILQHYEVDQSQCVADVNQFLEALMKQGIVSLVN